MSENQNPTEQNTGEPRQNFDSNWKEVGKQFQLLGESIAQAFRTSWENEETQRQVREMRTGLEKMVQDVGKAIEDTANTTQGQKIREEAGKVGDTIKTAAQQTVQEASPHVLTALERLNEELQKLIARMENANTKAAENNKPGEPPQTM